MSAPNKSLDKNKRYAGVKTNDFVNKTRTNEANRSAARPQGWANLGRINSRRIPPPANVPSLKSETGVNVPAFDPSVTVNHGWTSNENPTQQQLDSLPVNSPTPPPSASDVDKPRVPPTWSTITAGTSGNSNEPAPNLLALNDFPRLATTQDRKSQSESIPNIQSPSFRPANLAIWKEGGGTRIQPTPQDLSQILPNNTGANLYQQPQQQMRMYPPQQMWVYNPYVPVSLSMHQQRVHTLNDYKNPTILRNKDIDDLSKLTDNTWANTTQEVNYEEKIRFSDDDDANDVEIIDKNKKSRRMNPQVLQHTRFIQDDEYLKQMQDNKNSELINTLTIAKQRRDEQERHLRNKTYDDQISSNIDDRKQVPGYQTRPLLNSNEQENLNSSSSSSWQKNRESTNTSRTRHDTANSQTFAMRSWSDQMDSFNYASLHEKSGGKIENDEPSVPNKYSRSQSESSSQSQPDNKPKLSKSKKFPLPSNKQSKSSLIQAKSSLKISTKLDNKADYYDNNNNNQQMNSNDQWDNWHDESTENRYQQYPNDNRRRQQQQQQQQIHSDDHSTQKSNRYNEQPNNRTKQSSTKLRSNDRLQTNARSKPNLSTSNKNQSVNNKTQPAWQPLSPTQTLESPDPTPQDSISYKSQQRTGLNDHKQRYQTTNSSIINTASIPPLMSVRSDVTATAKLYKTTNHTGSAHYSQRNDFYNETNDDDYYDDETGYYDSSLQTHQRYQHSNLHNRGYTTLGSYGRYRRSGTLRHPQQYATYNMNHTSGISSAPSTNTGTRNKKNSTNRPSTNNKKPTESSEQPKSTVDEPKKSSVTEELAITKPIETPVSSPITEVLTTEIEKSTDSGNGVSDQKSSVKNANGSNIPAKTENESTKTNKKTTTSTSNTKRRTNKAQQNYHQDQRYQTQQTPRHRNNYAQSMQEYEAMQTAGTHNYYGTTRRTNHSGRNTHMHDLSSGYYYEHPQQHYNNRYNYSNEHYQQQQQQQPHSIRSTNKNSKRGNSSTITNRQQTVNGNNNNNNFRHHSISDTDQKEGEEWETASESSTNMRNGHYDNSGINNQQTNETKAINRGKTPPKKSFSSQRPNARQIFKYTNA